MTVFVVPYQSTDWISGVGESFRIDNWVKLVGNLKPDVQVKQKLMVQLVPDPKNKYDKKAVALHVNGIHVGYLPKETAALHFKDVLKVYADGNELLAYGSIWAVKRDGELKTNVSVNLPSKLVVSELLTSDDAPDQPTRSASSKVSNVIAFDTLEAASSPVKTSKPVMNSKDSPVVKFLLVIFFGLLKFFAVMIVAALLQAITGSSAVATLVFMAGLVWIFFGKLIGRLLKKFYKS